MALGFYFNPTSFTAADYDQLLGSWKRPAPERPRAGSTTSR